MKRFLWIVIVIVALLVIAGIFYAIFREDREKSEIILYGNVDVRQVNIGFRVRGLVEELFFEEGDYVAKGTVLARLDKTPYDSSVSAAQANVASIKANLENAEILLKRRQSLIGMGGVSQEDLDDSVANRNVLVANLAAAEANLATAQDNLSYTVVTAPNDGIILTRIREPGTAVVETDPIYTLSIISPVWIRAFVSEPQLGEIYYGMPAEVTTDSDQCYSGTIGFISPVSEFTPKTVETTELRTDLVYRLRIYVENADRYLKQGMPVTVKLKR